MRDARGAAHLHEGAEMYSPNVSPVNDARIQNALGKAGAHCLLAVSRRNGGFGRKFVEIFFQPGIAIVGDGLGTDGIVGIDVVSDLGIAGYQRPVHEYPPKNSRARKWDAAREEGKRSMGETRWEISGHTGNHTPLLFLRPIPTDGVSRARRLDSHV